MSKANRESRKAARQKRHETARANRQRRKELREGMRTARVENRAARKEQRQAAKMERQNLRQIGRAENLKARIANRATQIREQKQAADRELIEQANQQGEDVSVVAQNQLENNPQALEQLTNYVAIQSGQNPEELPEDVGELSNMAVQLRAEEINDIREPIVSEIEDEGDSMSDSFEDFEFFEAADYVNMDEFPECYENMEVIDPGTWATISGAAKGSLEVIAKRQFDKGKKFLGKTKEQWAAPEDPNSPVNVVYGNAAESYKSNFIKDNLAVIILVVVIISFLSYFAFKKK